MADNRVRKTVRLSPKADQQVAVLQKHFSLRSENEVFEHLLTQYLSIVNEVNRKHKARYNEFQKEHERRINGYVAQLNATNDKNKTYQEEINKFFEENKNLRAELFALRQAINNFLFGKERLVELLRGGESRGFDVMSVDAPDYNFLEPLKSNHNG